MHIKVQIEGGFALIPGLRKIFTLDTEQLSTEEAEKVDHLVEESHFFQLPAILEPQHAGAADYRWFTISIERGEDHHTVRIAEPRFNDPQEPHLYHLREIADFVQDHSEK